MVDKNEKTIINTKRKYTSPLSKNNKRGIRDENKIEDTKSILHRVFVFW